MINTLLALPFSQLADISRLGSTALIAAIWQGLILAAITALALRLFPRISAAARFAVWFAVFALIAALPFLGLLVHTASNSHLAASHSPWFNFDPRWTHALAAIWAAASFIRTATLIGAALRVHTLSGRAIPIQFSGLHHNPSTRHAQVCSSADVDRPTVIGFLSPKILIPAWLLEKLTPAELEQVILHEASHLNRSDDWLNLLQKFALVLFPLNPALTWVEHQLCFERELACDERVLAALSERKGESARAATDYASCLATLAEYRLHRRGLVHNLALALGALGTSARESELGRRVARILRPVAGMKPLHTRFAVGGAVLTLLFAATGLERCPQLIAFAPPSAASTQPPQLANLYTSAEQSNALLPGYRAVSTRVTMPASQWKNDSVGTATQMKVAIRQPHSTLPVSAHALKVSARRTQSLAAPRLLAAIPSKPASPAGDLIVTRWTVWQSTDGYRVVQTSAVVSSDSVPQSFGESPIADRSPEPANVRAPRSQQISQPVSPYAAMLVPGGWLVIQL